MKKLDLSSQDIRIYNKINFFTSNTILPDTYINIFGSCDVANIWRVIEQNLKSDPINDFIYVNNPKSKLGFEIDEDIYILSINKLFKLRILENIKDEIYKVNFENFIKIAKEFLK